MNISALGTLRSPLFFIPCTQKEDRKALMSTKYTKFVATIKQAERNTLMDNNTTMAQMRRPLRFALFGNEYQPKRSATLYSMLSFMRTMGAEIYIDRAFYDFLTTGPYPNLQVDGVFDGDDFDVDFVISMGGDGTFLKAAARVGAKLTPIIGINMGRLGFLADVLPAEAVDALQAIYAREYTIEDHTTIMVETDGEPFLGNPHALNDIAVLKRDNASMISIRTSVNGEFLVNYQADGLIVATPTGSTAYSLSNGGPIIVPQTGSICLTPVAPHSLNIRPIVLNDDSVVTLNVESRSHNFLIAVDGRSQKLTESTTLTIRKAPFAIRIVKRNDRRYFASLREKMMWGADVR